MGFDACKGYNPRTIAGGVAVKKKSYADMDPLEEIRAIKEEMSREFPTAKALGEYLRKKHPNVNAPTAMKRNAGKRLTHA